MGWINHAFVLRSPTGAWRVAVPALPAVDRDTAMLWRDRPKTREIRRDLEEIRGSVVYNTSVESALSRR
jgi:hypothetical protein